MPYFRYSSDTFARSAAAGKTIEQAEVHAALSVTFFNQPYTIFSPTGEVVKVIEPDDVCRVIPYETTKKELKAATKAGKRTFLREREGVTGETFVTGWSAHGGEWAAKVQIENGYIVKVTQ